MESWITLIQNLGFPIAISLYQLVVLNKTLKELTDEIKKVSKE